MPEAVNAPRNSSLWLGLAIAVAAGLCNAVYFVNPPAQAALPWLSLILGIIALVFIALGARQLFTYPRRIAAKVGGTVVVLLALFFSAGAIWIFVDARALPASADAPQVGQKAPDFTLTDTNGQAVTLTQLFAPTGAAAPRAVLLIFYRGYW